MQTGESSSQRSEGDLLTRYVKFSFHIRSFPLDKENLSSTATASTSVLTKRMVLYFNILIDTWILLTPRHCSSERHTAVGLKVHGNGSLLRNGPAEGSRNTVTTFCKSVLYG